MSWIYLVQQGLYGSCRSAIVEASSATQWWFHTRRAKGSEDAARTWNRRSRNKPRCYHLAFDPALPNDALYQILVARAEGRDRDADAIIERLHDETGVARYGRK